MGTRTYSRRAADGSRKPTALGIRTGRFIGETRPDLGDAGVQNILENASVQNIIENTGEPLRQFKYFDSSMDSLQNARLLNIENGVRSNIPPLRMVDYAANTVRLLAFLLDADSPFNQEVTEEVATGLGEAWKLVKQMQRSVKLAYRAYIRDEDERAWNAQMSTAAATSERIERILGNLLPNVNAENPVGIRPGIPPSGIYPYIDVANRFANIVNRFEELGAYYRNGIESGFDDLDDNALFLTTI